MKLFSRLLGLLSLLCCLNIQAQEKQIVIFSTNDMHARIHNFAKIGAYINDFKKQNPNVLVLSGGDMFSGNPVVDQYQDKGYPIVDLMNQVGYQFAAFGNHEFDYGQETLQKRRDQANFKMICANMTVDPAVGKMQQPEATAFTEIDGIKIGIVGIIEANMRSNGTRYPACHPDRVIGITFQDPVETIQKYKGMRQECDLFIGLSHAGIESDLLIADAMPELDAIVGGHSHTKIDSLLIRNGVMVTQAGGNTDYLSKLTFNFDGKKLVSRSYELISLRSLKKEIPEIAQAAQEFVDKSPLKTVLAETADQLNGKEELGGLMCDAIVDIHQVDFAFQNSGGVRIGQMKKGPITMEDVYTLDPFGNTVVIYNMTYSQLEEFIKNSYRKRNQSADLMCSGLKYIIYTHDGVATRVVITDEKNNPLDKTKTYKVGMNSYISSSYRFDKSGLVEESADSASDALIAYLKKKGTITRDIHRTDVREE